MSLVPLGAPGDLLERTRLVPEGLRVPPELPVLPLKDAVLYPGMVVPLVVAKPSSVQLVSDAAAGERILAIVAARSPAAESPGPDDLYRVGTAAAIVRLLRLPDGTLHLLVQGLSRIRLAEFIRHEPYLVAKVITLEEAKEWPPELSALARNILGMFQQLGGITPFLPPELIAAASSIEEPGRLADFIASSLNLSLEERQEILETVDLRMRLERVMAFLSRELELAELGRKIQTQVQQELEKGQREFILRKQLEAIQKELGMVDERTQEIQELREAISKSGMPPEVEKEALRELDRLSKMPPGAAEATVSRTYLDWLITLPWNKSTEDNLDITRAQRILDEDHYDLERVKERILEFLAVRSLRKDAKGPILCFVGPPGVGKTSLGQSIAKALGRKFVRISLGGVRDEAEIRGHRRTYVGALPGRIIQGIQRAGTNNPVFMLDEIDKIGADFRGDPAAALLEVLDPEQNHSFSDHYLGVPFDLSRVLFIATANVLHTIPPALLDRMEVITIPGYTEEQKVEIARRYLIPRQLAEHGLSAEILQFTDEGLVALIRGYTREAGLRNLEREIAGICRKVARRVAAGQKEKVVVVPEMLEELVGPVKFHSEMLLGRDEVGSATGMAWTPVGGDILHVEVALVKGRGRVVITGQLGEVMQESAKAALTYIRSRAQELGIPEDLFEHHDLHIHVPAGAIPKDGPSAGVTIATAVASAATKRPVRKRVAMTGEITLHGRVLPVGGIREKVLAAHRSGVEEVILPKGNEQDLREVPASVREALRIHLVEHMDEILKIALVGEPIPQPAAAGGS